MPIVVNGASITSKSNKRTGTDLRSVATKGLKVQLTDGQWYYDWQGGLYGPLFGYNPDWWIKAVSDAAHTVSANSIPCQGEVEVGDLLVQFYPDIEAVRFMLNGSDPCAAAVKLARAVTGRDKILVQGYHGTASSYHNVDGENRGILAAEIEASPLLEFGDFEAMKQVNDTYAAIVLELPAIMGDRYDDDLARRFLHTAADIAHANGALLILDEVVTGFRLAAGGAAEVNDLFGKVDIYCFGKAIANGYPVACLAGKKDVLNELCLGVHFSATFFGEPIGMAAAAATLRRMLAVKPWPYMYEIGHELARLWNNTGLPWHIVGHPVRPHLEGPKEGFEDFRRAMFEQGHILFNHPWYTTFAHTHKDLQALITDAATVYVDQKIVAVPRR